ncbi:MAG: cytochrome biosis protein [Microbacteriaceae bacterium]|nr:cytochrome biosis protein [Microbacteriaceae bacterium]
MALGVLLFIAGFSTVYVGLTLVFSLAGLYLIPWLGLITRIAGVLVFAMGLVFIGQLTFLQKVIKPSWTVATGLGGAPLLGVVFALGWAPCSGPTLSVVLSLSLGSASPTRGVILGIAYCLGIGIPFLLAALGLDWMANSIAWVKRNIRTINVVGGLALMVIGLVMIAGIWQLLMSRLGSLLPGFVSPI